MDAITVENLCKGFRSPQKGTRGFWRRAETREVMAVRGISFAIRQGERVAFIGPNGAGKSTTLKMLTGILHPSSGYAEVMGYLPWTERQLLAYRIGIVFGQRSQLWHHLPVRTSFELLRCVYGVPRADYALRLKRLAEVFEIADLLDRAVAQLSLGQRIRCELVGALLHAPRVLLLDEPSIGLDVTAKAALRDHLTGLSKADGTTVLLTSHDTGDIEKICDRVIVIDQGSLLLDEPLAELRQRYMRYRTVFLVTRDAGQTLALPGVTVTPQGDYRLRLDVDITQAPLESVVAAVLTAVAVRDIVIENQPLEEVIQAIYRQRGGGQNAAA